MLNLFCKFFFVPLFESRTRFPPLAGFRPITMCTYFVDLILLYVLSRERKFSFITVFHTGGNENNESFIFFN